MTDLESYLLSRQVQEFLPRLGEELQKAGEETYFREARTNPDTARDAMLRLDGWLRCAQRIINMKGKGQNG